MENIVNLRYEGESFFDLLKAVIRQWQNSPWQHERERAVYAGILYQRCLRCYADYLEEAKAKAEKGYNTEADRKLVKELAEKLAYWQRKLEELESKGKVASCGF